MAVERSYRNYEEFEREELKKTQRLSVSYEDLLGDFIDDRWARNDPDREGLFDSYDTKRNSNEYDD